MSNGKATLYGNLIILESDHEQSSHLQSLRALSEQIYQILQVSLPLGQITGRYQIRDKHGKVTWSEINPINRTMHVDPAEVSSPKIREKNEPELNTASMIALCFESGVTANSTATNSELEWAFWKPILIYAMSTECKKSYVLDQLVQVIWRLQHENGPSALGTDFYTKLRGLDQAWDTCECFAPLDPPPFQRQGFLDDYPDLHEMWPFSMSSIQSEALPSTQRLNNDVRPWNMPIIPSRSGSERPKHMSHDYWRNLNDFTARLYAVQNRMAGDGWRCGDFGSVTTKQEWWVWKALYALIEAFEDAERGKSTQARNTAYSVALTWLSYHGPNLRNTNLVKDVRDHLYDARTTSAEAAATEKSLRQIHQAADISRSRKADAIASLFPLFDSSEPDPMAARWSTWFEYLDMSESRIYSGTEDSDSENPETEGSETKKYRVKKREAKMRATKQREAEYRVEDVVCSNLIKSLEDQLRNILVDHVSQRRIEGPADEGLEQNARQNTEWQSEIRKTCAQKSVPKKSTKRECPRKEKAEETRKNIEEIRKNVKEKFRQRLYRQHTAQEFLYPFFERNALRRKYVARVGNSWVWKTDKKIEEAAQWSRILTESKEEVIDTQQLASQLYLRHDPGDTVQTILGRYWESRMDKTLAKMRIPLPPEAEPVEL